ncbi:LysM peptidoglycan-binding domain-containing protein [Halomonas urumqiensis]|uniref:LysM domain-containing protein n=1 Tax=Halomonas urumqiensis TaxID=1684789 RepID=A0A2N7UCX5_9GAMM|nr:tail protein X [Halomonas urumqiensis]PMR78302.1 hypothetical protein C1H70_16205 [Halomonas urumqiensis]PTB03449.1 hypothetical protein C6V82_02840 [Halomonas urumqiensis]GHE20367.1 hypothetical protein GCM10017767_08880 [Halomonas urumqiensis]
MLLKKSRYTGARAFEPQGDPGTFPGLRARRIEPLEGVIEHTVTDGDRLDHLAHHYYNDNGQWWRIVDANPELLDGGRLMHPDWVGEVILIPAAKRG